MKPLKQRREEDGYWPGTDFSSTSGSGCAEDHGRPLMQPHPDASAVESFPKSIASESPRGQLFRINACGVWKVCGSLRRPTRAVWAFAQLVASCGCFVVLRDTELGVGTSSNSPSVYARLWWLQFARHVGLLLVYLAACRRGSSRQSLVLVENEGLGPAGIYQKDQRGNLNVDPFLPAFFSEQNRLSAKLFTIKALLQASRRKRRIRYELNESGILCQALVKIKKVKKKNSRQVQKQKSNQVYWLGD